MNNLRWLGLAALVGLLGWAPARVQAQYQSPIGGYSPYLNLLRGGSSLTSNYYGIVRPQLGFDAGLQQLQRQVQYGQQSLYIQTYDPGVVTGVVAGFQTQGSYFRGANSHPFGLVNASLPGTASSQQRSLLPGLNTPGFYSTQTLGTPPTTPPTTPKPPGQ
jgi:hypothetical protein